MSNNVIHPGRVLRAFIEFLLLSKSSAASHLGVSRATLFRILGEDGRITTDVAMRLERAFHVPALYWLQRQAEFDIQQAANSGDYQGISRLKSSSETCDALSLAEGIVTADCGHTDLEALQIG